MPDIMVWNGCNNNCVMCTRYDGFFGAAGKDFSLKKLARDLENYKAGDLSVYTRNRSDASYFLLSGGEPTLHQQFLSLVRLFRKKNPELEITVLTNGRRFAYKKLAAGFWKAAGSPARAAVSICGSTAKTHDGITRSEGSFAQTTAGIKNLLACAGAGQRVEVRVVLCAKTEPELAKILRCILKEFPGASVNIIYFKAKGRARKHLPELLLPLKKAADALLECRGILGRFAEARISHVPLCVLDEKLRRFSRRSLAACDLARPKKCRRCSARKDCSGLLRWYGKFYGDGELSPYK